MVIVSFSPLLATGMEDSAAQVRVATTGLLFRTRTARLSPTASPTASISTRTVLAGADASAILVKVCAPLSENSVYLTQREGNVKRNVNPDNPCHGDGVQVLRPAWSTSGTVDFS